MELHRLKEEELLVCRKALEERYQAFQQKGYQLFLTRGKPCAQQLDLSLAMLDQVNSASDLCSAEGEDCRNYGVPDGLKEARALLGELLEVPVDSVIMGNNSSLSLMFDVVSCGMTHGFGGCKPWGKQEKIKFLCPVPGYDRHFSISEYLGFEMIPIPMTAQGPDMDLVEQYVTTDAAVKGIWCVPKYSNPTGVTYSDETVRRFAHLKPAAQDFRIFWDNAYCVHDLTETPDSLLSLYEACKAAGTLTLPFLFTSTSKITFAGAGLAAVASFNGNLTDLRRHFSMKTIGPDKLSQLAHVRFLQNKAGVSKIMEAHRAILAPKFELVEAVLQRELGGKGVAAWTKPKGGYFVSVDVVPGTAKQVVALCQQAGLTLNAAGSTYPYNQDAQDSNIRIAPTFPPLEELRISMEIFSVCASLAAIEKRLDDCKASARRVSCRVS